MTKYVFVTGGVVSSIGKGIATACLGTLLKARGLKVSIQKIDPYLNVDAGTMNPHQHGEVFVTEDGAELIRSRRDFQDSRLHADLRSRKRERVRFVVLEDDDFPILFVGENRRDRARDALHVSVRRGVAFDRSRLLHLVEGLNAHRIDFTLRDEHRLLATFGRRRARSGGE